MGHSSRDGGPQSRHASCSSSIAPHVLPAVPLPMATVFPTLTFRHISGADPRTQVLIHGERPDPVLETGCGSKKTKSRPRASSAGPCHHSSPSQSPGGRRSGAGGRSSLPEAREYGNSVLSVTSRLSLWQLCSLSNSSPQNRLWVTHRGHKVKSLQILRFPEMRSQLAAATLRKRNLQRRGSTGTQESRSCKQKTAPPPSEEEDGPGTVSLERRSSSVPWLPRRPMASWGALGRVWPAGRGRFSFPSTLPW